MKKIILMAVVMLSSVATYAQNAVGQVTIQPKVGLSIANVTDIDGTDPRYGVVAGAEFEYGVSDIFGLSAGALYSMQTFVELEPHFVKAGAEVIEKLVVDFTPCQHLFVVPDGFLVGNISHITDAKEVTKTGAVDNLILYLMVAQTVVTLKK
jgi:hypothetical protein